MPRNPKGPKRIDGPNAMRRTSIQLPKETVHSLSTTPGLSMSEALRLRLERYDWLMAASSQRAKSVVGVAREILRGALSHMAVTDYVVVARALPELVFGYMAEVGLEDDDALVGMLRDLSPAERVLVLDLVKEEARNA